MSGGSFNYLFMKMYDVLDLGYEVREGYPMMIEALRLNDCQVASDDLRAIMDKFFAFRREFYEEWEKLEPVLKAMEWVQSCDWDDDALKDAYEKYLENKKQCLDQVLTSK